MALLTKNDLGTHMPIEVIDEITRANPALVDAAINTALSEVKSYLGKYDLAVLFASNDIYLKDLVKDVAAWKLARLANPNISLEILRTGYEDAKDTLSKIQKGLASPDGWPYKVDDTETRYKEGANIQWSSNRKKQQHF